jgi:outer membrane protein OmpA-like peptidoglycan-associated protein
VPYVHAGYARLAAGSFAGGLGVMIPVPLGKRVSIVPDLKVTALSGTAFSGGTQRLAANFSATLGLRIRLGKLDRPSKPLPPVEPVNLPVVDTVTQVKTVVDTVKVTVIERIKEVVEQPAPKPDYPEEHVVQFDYTSSQLQNRYLPMLDAWAAYLASHPDVDIVIFGYTCDIGSDETNDVLSFKRAAAVRDHLTARGINPARITVHGYGESNPVAPNDTEANRSLNRRAEIFIH